LELGSIQDTVGKMFRQSWGDGSNSNNVETPSGTNLEFKPNLHVLSKPRRIVVADCHCVAERLQHRVGAQKTVADGSGSVHVARIVGEKLQDLLGAFCAS
jgi:hypothetical protein